MTYFDYICYVIKIKVMTTEQALRTDNFQERDARSAKRKTLAMVLVTIGGVNVEKLEIV